MNDNIKHPAHYTDGGIETIDFIRAKLTPEEFAGYCKGNIGMDCLAVKNICNLKHIKKGRVCTRADTYLIDLDLTDLVYALYVVGAVRTSEHRLKCRKVNIIFKIVIVIIVGKASGTITLIKYFKSLVPSTLAAR